MIHAPSPHILRGYSLVAFVIGLALGLVALPTHAQQPGLRTVPGASDAEQGIALTVSGGVSKGAYQGGFVYGLTYLMRLSREDPRIRDVFDVPAYHLVSATGASAGNINALLAAVSWCDSTFIEQSPQESLFWRVWIPVGMEQLFPETRPEQPFMPDFVFSRQFFHTEVAPRLKEAMHHPVRRGCEVPVGLTLTRIDSFGHVPFAPSLDPVRTIRYASIARLASTSIEGEPGMRFRPFDFTGLDLQQYGELLLPDLAPSQNDLGVDPMVRVALGSSAFPLAFAPVEITFSSGPDEPRETGYFIDGGVFDNNPLGLSSALYNPRLRNERPDEDMKLRAYVGPRRADPRSVPVYSLLVNQNHRRGTPPAERQAEITSRSKSRISARAYNSFLNKAITTAREYEMELLARDLTETDRKRIVQSSRYHAIMGESLISFGAFFSYLFRQHDFFVGLYDAVHFAAEQSVHDRTNRSDVGARVRALIDVLEPQLQTAEHDFLLSLHRDEFAQERVCEPFTSSQNVYLALSCAVNDWERTHGTEPSGAAENFGRLFEHIETYITPDRFIALEKQACQAEKATSVNEAGRRVQTDGEFRCDAITDDGLLLQMQANADQTVTRILESALEILIENEHEIDATMDEATARDHITLAYFIQRNLAIEGRTGFSWDSSSMPVERRKRRGVDAPAISRRLIWRTVVPNEVIFPVARKGWGFSYRPRYYPGPRHAPRIPLLLGYNKFEGQPGLFLTGLGLEQPIFSGPRRLIVNSVEVGITQGIATTGTGDGWRYTGLNVGLYILGGKIRFGLLLPSLLRHPETNLYSGHQTSIGISDVNGLLYWIGKFIQ
ncbi:patatin-like phospholipase family protein [Longibacter salinarum]|nr:patatin-like phospholipase family protein [Longibacter salinarum]